MICIIGTPLTFLDWVEGPVSVPSSVTATDGQPHSCWISPLPHRCQAPTPNPLPTLSTLPSLNNQQQQWHCPHHSPTPSTSSGCQKNAILPLFNPFYSASPPPSCGGPPPSHHPAPARIPPRQDKTLTQLPVSPSVELRDEGGVR